MALEARDPAQCTIVQLSIDHRIPFCEYFIIPYLLWSPPRFHKKKGSAHSTLSMVAL